MSNFYCEKCGSLNLHTNKKGTATGLYCKDCNSWIKWLGKKDLEAFEQHQKETLSLILGAEEEEIETSAKEYDIYEFMGDMKKLLNNFNDEELLARKEQIKVVMIQTLGLECQYAEIGIRTKVN